MIAKKFKLRQIWSKPSEQYVAADDPQLDWQMLEVITALNNIDGINTHSCCFGHMVNQPAIIEFGPMDEDVFYRFLQFLGSVVVSRNLSFDYEMVNGCWQSRGSATVWIDANVKILAEVPWCPGLYEIVLEFGERTGNLELGSALKLAGLRFVAAVAEQFAKGVPIDASWSEKTGGIIPDQHVGPPMSYLEECYEAVKQKEAATDK